MPCGILRLRCPECCEWNVVPGRKLKVGYALRCLHWREGLYVDRVHVELKPEPLWQLESRDG